MTGTGVMSDIKGLPSASVPVELKTVRAGTIGMPGGIVTRVVEGRPSGSVPTDVKIMGVVNIVGVGTIKMPGGIFIKVVKGVPLSLTPVDVKPATGTTGMTGVV